MYRITPVVKYLLIINFLVFGIQQLLPIPLTMIFGLYYFGLSEFQLYQYITNFFTHANFPHIAFNMISLYSVGMMLEQVWGSKRFLNFYLICGLGAGLFHTLVQAIFVYTTLEHFMIGSDDMSQVYQIIGGPAVGASGAIFGVFTAIALLFPNTEFMIMFIPVPIKAKYLLIGLVLLDFGLGVFNFTGDNIGHWAHLGGVITGYIMIKIYQKDKRRFY